MLEENDQSLRPSIVGFSLSKMQDLIGSKDEYDLACLKDCLNSYGGEESIECIEESKKILDRAIKDGMPFSDLIEEKMSHVIAASVLAEYSQDLTPTDSLNWETNIFWTLAEQFEFEFEPECKKLFAYLCEGRPIFGKLIQTDRSYYAYLKHEEIAVLNSDLKQIIKHIEDWEERGVMEFLDDFTGWLDTIYDLKQDLWLSAI